MPFSVICSACSVSGPNIREYGRSLNAYVANIKLQIEWKRMEAMGTSSGISEPVQQYSEMFGLLPKQAEHITENDIKYFFKLLTAGIYFAISDDRSFLIVSCYFTDKIYVWFNNSTILFYF